MQRRRRRSRGRRQLRGAGRAEPRSSRRPRNDAGPRRPARKEHVGLSRRANRRDPRIDVRLRTQVASSTRTRSTSSPSRSPTRRGRPSASRLEPCSCASAACRTPAGPTRRASTERAGYILTGPDLLVGGRRPAGWPLDRDPLALETSVPASSPRATPAAARPSALPGPSGRARWPLRSRTSVSRSSRPRPRFQTVGAGPKSPRRRRARRESRSGRAASATKTRRTITTRSR